MLTLRVPPALRKKFCPARPGISRKAFWCPMPETSQELQDHLSELLETSLTLRMQVAEIEAEIASLTRRIASHWPVVETASKLRLQKFRCHSQPQPRPFLSDRREEVSAPSDDCRG